MKARKMYGVLCLVLWCSQWVMAQDKAAEIRERFLSGTDRSVLVVSHRGDWRNAPENSLQAFQNCIDMGADMVEIDLKRTKDGELVVIHDNLINRTMNGKGRVDEYTLAELKAMRLKNGAGCVTRHQIPTFEEVMNLCKGRIMVNVDKGYPYFKEAYEVMRKTGTVDQCLVKAGLPYDTVQAENGALLKEVLFMPIVNLNKEGAGEMIDAWLAHLKPKAFELVFSVYTPEVQKLIEKVRSNGSKAFISSLWPSLCAGHDDDRAVELGEPEESWGWIVEQGASLIQTDRPALLLQYLRARQLHP